MAAVTLLGTATFNTTSGTKTVTATPAVGDLIVIVTANSGSTTTTAAPTDNNSSGTYTVVNTAVKATSADTMQIWVRDSLIASATSTVFTQAPGTTTGGGLVVLKITGMSRTGSSAIVRSAIQSNQAAGTPAPVLAATPGLANAIIGAVFNATNPATMTPRTNYTERADVGYNTPTSGLEVMSDDSGETSATITWGSASASAYCSIAVEIDARVTHDTTGALPGLTAAVTGSASRVVTHATTGALTGPGSTIAGTAAHVAKHDTTGTLTGPGSTTTGSATRFRQLSTSGTLVGAGTTVVGSSQRFRAFGATGALSGQNATVAGTADRQGAFVSHATTGALTGSGSVVDGAADRSAPTPDTYQRGEGWIPQIKRKRKFSEERDEREQLRKIIEAAVDPVTEKQAKVVTVKGEVAVVTESQTIPLPTPPTFDAQAVAKLAVSVLEAHGIEAQRVRDAKAREQARIALEAMRRKIIKRRREEELLLLM